MTAIQSWGRTIGRGRRRWRLLQEEGGFRLEAGGSGQHFSGTHAKRLSVRRSWFRPVLSVTQVGTTVCYRGMDWAHSRGLEQALATYLARIEVASALASITAWAASAEGVIGGAETSGRWIPDETTRSLVESQPQALATGLSRRGQSWLDATLSSAERRLVSLALRGCSRLGQGGERTHSR